MVGIPLELSENSKQNLPYEVFCLVVHKINFLPQQPNMIDFDFIYRQREGNDLYDDEEDCITIVIIIIDNGGFGDKF